jgi:hypothetical protein
VVSLVQEAIKNAAMKETFKKEEKFSDDGSEPEQTPSE